MEEKLVFDTLYEISLLVDVSLFCGLFAGEDNSFSSFGVSGEDYERLSLIMESKLSTEDDFYLQFGLLYDMFGEIALCVNASLFLDLFNYEENVLSFLGISDEKYMIISNEVIDVRNVIDNEKKLLLTK
ncbi:MAG: hypothetical protein IKE75_06070 [Bacilli bacterium]|nr:hypothetical protein [Bacilli bacterium]